MHPVHFDADYEIERNRLTAFFRLLLAIPWIIVIYIWTILAYVGAIISWFAMLFTGRHPVGIYDFLAKYIRFAGRSTAWMLLMTDDWPSFSGGADDSYPILVDVDPRQESYSRAKTFFKLVLYFPQMLIGYGVGILLQAGAFISWWRILFTGKQSATMHDALRAGLAYHLRSMSFLLLLTETHPRLLDLPAQEYPPGTPALPQPATAGPSERLMSQSEAAAQAPPADPPPAPPGPPAPPSSPSSQ